MFDISQPYILHAFFSIHNLCGYNHVGHFLTVEIKKKNHYAFYNTSEKENQYYIIILLESPSESNLSI